MLFQLYFLLMHPLLRWRRSLLLWSGKRTKPHQNTPLLFLSTAKDQEVLNINSPKATLAQEFPTTVNRELGHDHDDNILEAAASFI
jgi:hypothetical protein